MFICLLKLLAKLPTLIACSAVVQATAWNRDQNSEFCACFGRGGGGESIYVHIWKTVRGHGYWNGYSSWWGRQCLGAFIDTSRTFIQSIDIYPLSAIVISYDGKYIFIYILLWESAINV
jgi:hypothetical protein